jgi:hypothetical protein
VFVGFEHHLGARGAQIAIQSSRDLLRRDLRDSPGGIIGNARSQLCSSGYRDGLLPARFRQAAIFSRLNVPRDLSPQVLAVRNRMLRAEQLLMQRLQLPCVHPVKIPDLRQSTLFLHRRLDSFLRPVNLSSWTLASAVLSRDFVDGIGAGVAGTSRTLARRKYAVASNAAISSMASSTLDSSA